MIGNVSITELAFADEWPRPVSRKTSEDGARLNEEVGQEDKKGIGDWGKAPYSNNNK
jgi:hypothetical protein